MDILLYGRVSNLSQQGDNFSISAQLDKMREHATRQSWNVVAELEEKESAYHQGLERTQLNVALDMARAKKINALMYFSPDRFTREMGDGIILRRELARLGVKLFCYYPSVREVTSDNEILDVLLDWQNQQFIEKLKVFSKMGVERAIQEGRYPQGQAPFGYKIDETPHGNFLKIDEEAGWVIHDIYTWYYYNGMGTTEIAERLNEAGYKPNTQNRGSGKWTNKRVIDILGNETYAGTWYAYRYRTIGKKKFELRPREEWVAISIPPIVSRSLWENVQERLRSRHNGRDTTNQYLMGGRINHSCGLGMSGKPTTNSKGQKFLYYRCNSANTKGGACGPDLYFNAEAVDETVWRFALELIQNPDKIIEAHRELQEEAKEETERETRQLRVLSEKIEELEAQLAAIIDQRSRTKVKAVADALESRAEELGGAIEELEGRRSKLEENLSESQLTEAGLQGLIQEVNGIREVYEALHAIEEEADFQAKHVLVSLLDLKATLRTSERGRWVDIHFAGKEETKEVSSISRRQKPLCSFRRTTITFSIPLFRVKRAVVI